jgi:hypothetical protein
MYKPPVNPGFAKQIMPILLISCYNRSLITWTAVSLTTAKFKPVVFSVSGFALSYATNMFLWFCMTSACCLYSFVIRIIVYIRKVKGRVQIADRHAPWKISSDAETVDSKVKVTLRLTASKSVSLVVEPHLRLMTRYLLLFDSYGLVFL